MLRLKTALCTVCLFVPIAANAQEGTVVEQTAERINVTIPSLKFAIQRKGYVSGVAGKSFVDRKTGFHDAGFGLDIVDWIMEPGSDEAYRDQLDPELVYRFGDSVHGKTAKRSIEGPQICTKARELAPEFFSAPDPNDGSCYVVKQSFKYKTAAPGKKTGSTWTQTMVFPDRRRYFISCDRIDAVNDSPAMFLRIDMPGHIIHNRGDTFSEVYLSYAGRIPSQEFLENFAPDEKFNYRRDDWEKAGKKPPERMIRGYKLRDPATGKEGPWLLGMTLDPAVVSEAWCHQRGYVCMIEEFGGRPIKAGESFSAAFIVGFFDSIEEAEKVYDRYQGARGLEVDQAAGWKLTK